MAPLPSSGLVACTENAVRSPMAEAILKHLVGKRLYVDSAGLRAGTLDAMAVEVLQEIGIDAAKHKPKTFDQLEDGFYDLIVTLSPEAQHRAVELTRTMACDVEFWNTFDPTIVEGTRDQRLEAFRQVRDTLLKRIKERFKAES